MCIASSLITDASSDMYQRLLKDGTLNSTFGSEIFCGDGYFSVIFAGESNDPVKVRNSIADEIKKISENGIPEKDFQRIKKSMYGAMIRQLNNVEAVASMMLGASMAGVTPYDMIDVISEMTSDTVLEYIRNELKEDRLVMSVVEETEND